MSEVSSYVTSRAGETAAQGLPFLLGPCRVRSIVISGYVCQSVCFCICLSVRSLISQNTHPKCARYLRFFSDKNAICYVLPVLWMTSYFYITERLGRIKDEAYVLSSPVAGTEGEVYRFRLHLVIKIYVALEFVLLLYWTGAGDRLFLMRRTQNFKYVHNSEYRERIKVMHLRLQTSTIVILIIYIVVHVNTIRRKLTE